MLQVLFRIPIITEWTPDGIPIYGFGMMLFLAFLACTWLGGRRGEREGISKETIQDLAIWIFAGGLLGARTTYLLSETQVSGVWDFLSRLPRIWDGGIVLYGSVLGAVGAYVVSYFLVFRKRGVDTLVLLDVVAPSVALGVMLGRFGCFLNGCCFGQVACATCLLVPPAVTFPLSAPPREVLVGLGYQTAAGFTLHRNPVTGVTNVVDEVDPSSQAYREELRPGARIVAVNDHDTPSARDLNRVLGSLEGLPRGESKITLTFIPKDSEEEKTITIYPRSLPLYPTQLYEVISMGLLLLVLLAYEPFRRNPGQVAAVLLAGYGLHRFLNELLRDDPRPEGFERYGSVLCVLIGAVLWFVLQYRNPASSRGAATTPAPVSPPAPSVQPGP
jgi:prolipoprotein diacylglyceryltransferase